MFKEIVGEYVARLGYEYNNSGLEKFGGDVKALGGGIMQLGGMLTAAITVPIVGIGVSATIAAAKMEKLQTSFETLTQSKEKGAQLYKEIIDTASKTPYRAETLAKGAETMMAFGIQSEKVVGNLKVLGDIALGDSEKMRALTLAFSQSRAMGRLQGQDLLQMVNAGFNPLEMIAKKTGKTMAELKDEMSKGNISFDMVKQAFIDATGEGEKFYKGMERGSQTLAGLTSTLQDNISIALAELGKSFQGIIKAIVKKLIILAQAVAFLAKVFGKLPKPIKLIVVGFAAIIAIIPVLLFALGAATMGFGALAFSMGAIVKQKALLLTTFETITAGITSMATAIWTYLSPIIIPILLVVAALVGLIAIFGLFKNDYETWKAGGDSFFSKLWVNFEKMKNWFNKIKPYIGAFVSTLLIFLGIILVIPAAIWLVYQAFKGWMMIFDLISKNWTKWIDSFVAWLYKLPAKIKKIATGIKKIFADMFAGLKNGLKKILSLPGLNWLAKRAGIDLTLQNPNTVAGGTIGGTSNQSTTVSQNAGGFTINVAGSNATPEQIGAATKDGVSSAFSDVYSWNAPAWGVQ